MTASIKYQALNKCVYCGNINNLTDEHIIPFGLNANSILPKASCKECAKITSSFEHKVMRGFTLQMRTYLCFQTRRPGERPNSFQLCLVKNGTEEIIDAPVDKHPIFLVLPLFDFPTYLDNLLKKNRNYKKGIGLAGVQTLWFSNLEQLRQDYKADTIFVIQKLDHIAFARMLGKIAYCLAVEKFGLERIGETFVLPAILGKTNDIGKWVGSSSDVIAASPGISHTTQIQTYKQQNSGDLIIVLIRLFSDIPSPGYIVIVGTLK